MKLARNQIKRRIRPGVWEDAEGELHFILPEILAHLGWPDDEEHRRALTEILKETIQEVDSGAIIVERTGPD